MTLTHTSAFDLPERLSPKADPALIAADEQHLAAVAASLDRAVAELTDRRDTLRRTPARGGQAAADRDADIHRVTARLRTLRRFGLDLCLGRIVPDDGSEPVYIGRLGLTDDAGRRLLVDWRSPAAEPFFAATHAHPMGLESRRRYRWVAGRVGDYWDEVFTAEGLEGNAALDDKSAFVASLGASRSEQMRDVLGTIQADQDAIIRAGSQGALVVDGGPGTGKTVVALHRAAYLLYSDPRVEHRRGGVLFVGPHEEYLAYIADVLPRLGEDGVRTCTVRDLLPEGATALAETDPEVARLKGSVAMVEAIEPAVGLYERPPEQGLLVETEWADLWLSPADWADVFESVEPGTPHNEARDRVWESLVDLLLGRLRDELQGSGPEDAWGEERVDDADDDPWGDTEDSFDAYGVTAADPTERYRRALSANRDLARTFGRAWPLIEPTDLVGDLWSVPAYLRMCAPWLEPAQVAALQRDTPDAWTVADLPLLDAARRRLGDPDASRRRRREQAAASEEAERRADVTTDLIASDDSDMKIMSMLRGQDLRHALSDGVAPERSDVDALAGPFAHVVVDEAQELTDAEWQMLVQRCPTRSFTVVGDRAQARRGFTEQWSERLARVGLDEATVASLSVNYRTPQEVMAEAEPVIRAVLPDANVPSSVRSSGRPVVHGRAAELDDVVGEWLATHADGTACVVGAPGFASSERVQSLSPEHVKGLEFDLVVLVDPQDLGAGVPGAVDRYVAMTRATQDLVVLTSA